MTIHHSSRIHFVLSFAWGHHPSRNCIAISPRLALALIAGSLVIAGLSSANVGTARTFPKLSAGPAGREKYQGSRNHDDNWAKHPNQTLPSDALVGRYPAARRRFGQPGRPHSPSLHFFPSFRFAILEPVPPLFVCASCALPGPSARWPASIFRRCAARWSCFTTLTLSLSLLSVSRGTSNAPCPSRKARHATSQARVRRSLSGTGLASKRILTPPFPFFFFF